LPQKLIDIFFDFPNVVFHPVGFPHDLRLDQRAPVPLLKGDGFGVLLQVPVFARPTLVWRGAFPDRGYRA
jgi:hypothetical protein